jgi:hypothetical protein
VPYVVLALGWTLWVYTIDDDLLFNE